MIIRKYPSILKVLIVVFCLFINSSVIAQIDQLEAPDPCTDPSLPCPIDGGLSLLIAAGIGIGAKKAYDTKKKNKESITDI